MAKTESPMFHIDTVGWKKIGIGVLITAGGAALTYLADAIPGIDFGQMTPVVVSIASILINTARKWLSTYPKN